jgi:hypothetical protein
VNAYSFDKSRGNFVRWQGAKRANTTTYTTDEQRSQRAKGLAVMLAISLGRIEAGEHERMRS